ncbi:carotenoid 9,10(9',10')-cleavage dioxygenase-like [Hordeum vulgare]|nr:carotenoid 9,10(9',10')-cleavage dioxygenase-like [Hordeum vulgare]
MDDAVEEPDAQSSSPELHRSTYFAACSARMRRHYSAFSLAATLAEEKDALRRSYCSVSRRLKLTGGDIPRLVHLQAPRFLAPSARTGRSCSGSLSRPDLLPEPHPELHIQPHMAAGGGADGRRRREMWRGERGIGWLAAAGDRVWIRKMVAEPQLYCSGLRQKNLRAGRKSLIQQLQSQLSIKIDEASHVMKKVPQILLDAIVDSAFKFTDQALHSSESNFAPVDEIGGSIEILQLEGNIPEDFPEGVYIRNGSNPLFGALQSTASIFGESNDIWVEGEGMLHALYFTKKNSASWSVSYANGYVQSETLKIERDRQKPCFLPAAQGDSAAVISAYILNYLRFGKVNKNISNTNVFEHAGRVYAVAESHQPQEICIQNLETGNTWDIHEQWDRPCTSHPKVAPESRELVIFGSDAKKPFLVVGVISDDGTRLKHKVDLKLDRPTLCHDIGVTIRYTIIMDLPLTVDIGRLTTGGQLIEFEKEGYARIGVMPRYGDAESVVWFDVEPCCMFHLINCFEEGDEVHSIR